MKTLLCLAIAVGTLASPALTFAQATTPAPLTRAQVVADLVRIEQAGYKPGLGDDPHYPADIQAAEEKVIAQQAPQQAPREQDSVGGASGTSSSATGGRGKANERAECSGPVTFCDIYSGS